MTDVDAFLAGKLAEVEAELGGLSAVTEDSGGISFGKRVGDGTSIAVERLAQVAAHDRLLVLRGDVVRALAKRADGTYGGCDRCGEPIGEDRLAAVVMAGTASPAVHRRRTRSARRHRVRAGDRYRLGEAARRARLQVGLDLLAPAPRVAGSRSVGPAAPCGP